MQSELNRHLIEMYLVLAMICLKRLLTGCLTTTTHSYMKAVTECLCHISFYQNHNHALSYSWLATIFLTGLIRRVPLVEQEVKSIYFTNIWRLTFLV